jgi:hypothetical protein
MLPPTAGLKIDDRPAQVIKLMERAAKKCCKKLQGAADPNSTRWVLTIIIDFRLLLHLDERTF